MAQAIPTYKTLLDTVETLTATLKKSQSNHKASLKTIKVLHDEMTRLNSRIQKLESVAKTPNNSSERVCGL